VYQNWLRNIEHRIDNGGGGGVDDHCRARSFGAQ